jgi:ABC-type transport system involved in multi-copper enzyme maturation permease subunit
VVKGKSLIHGLRALSLLLVALPVLAIAFMLGGVSWREGLMALAINVSSVCLALVAGLLGSSMASRWNRALLLAEVFALLFLLLLGAIHTFVFICQVALGFGFDWKEVSIEEFLIGPPFLLTGAGGVWNELINSTPVNAGVRQWLLVGGETLFLSVLFSVLMILVIARRVRESWRRDDLSARQIWWQRFLFSPRFLRSALQIRMRRMLERNPIGWLQQRTASARLTKWGWCLIVAIAQCLLLGWFGQSDFNEWELGLLILLAFGLAASAAGSFQRERENGSLELLLVTPVSVVQVIIGRLRGVWGQFLPAVCLCVIALSVLNLALGTAAPGSGWLIGFEGSWVSAGMLIATTFATTPLIGLHASLTRRHFISAWMLTLGKGLLVPLLSVGATHLLVYTDTRSKAFVFSAVQLTFATFAGVALYDRLSRRRFAPG